MHPAPSSLHRVPHTAHPALSATHHPVHTAHRAHCAQRAPHRPSPLPPAAVAAVHGAAARTGPSRAALPGSAAGAERSGAEIRRRHAQRGRDPRAARRPTAHASPGVHACGCLARARCACCGPAVPRRGGVAPSRARASDCACARACKLPACRAGAAAPTGTTAAPRSLRARPVRVLRAQLCAALRSGSGQRRVRGSEQRCAHGSRRRRPTEGWGNAGAAPGGGLTLRFAGREWKVSPSGMGARGSRVTERALGRTQQAAPSSDFFNLPHNVGYTRRRQWRGR